MSAKLTPAKRKVLEYLAAREFVSTWPMAISNRSVRNSLEASGVVEKFDADPGVFGFVRFRITRAGRTALALAHPTQEREGG